MPDDSAILPSRALLDQVVEICREAGRAILGVYEREDFDTSRKADDSPLTAADLASQDVLLAGLTRLAPETPAVSEESKVLPFTERRTWTQAWCIDPLDGTKEFIQRNGQFTVNVALLENGSPIAGVVHLPISDRTWFGAEGLGAWCRDGGTDGESRAMTAPGAGEDELVVAASRSHPGPLLEAALATLPPHRLQPLGSSLKICMVAAGEVDFYPRLGPTMEWDTAAADAVLRAAGGRLVGLDGEPLRYNKEDLLNPFFLAASAAFPRELQERVAQTALEARNA